MLYAVEHYNMARNKSSINITVDPEIIDWIDGMIEEKVFSSRSHAFEACVFWYKKQLESKKE